jgi:transcriptional regulator with XRE-family HTH domain
MTETLAPRVGPLLRDWRTRRRMSQMDLALEAGVSTRHLSYVETGRSRPSAEMVLTLAECLDVPLRDRNALLLAAGHAPAYGQRGLEDPEMGAAREVLDEVLAGHEPYPALVVDRHWGLVAGNRALEVLTAGAAPWLLEPPVNVLRLALHPDGLAPRVRNAGEWRAQTLEGLGREAVSTGDPALAALHAELAALPAGESAAAPDPAASDIAVRLRLRATDTAPELAFISTRTSFGTAVDVTLAELHIESFFPADAATRAYLQERAAGRAGAED